VTTEASARSDCVGSPVAGSMRWWRTWPLRVHTRRSTLDVAIAPAVRPTSAIGVSENGCSIASVQPNPSGLSPRTRRSPPMLTQIPAIPVAISSVATRSAECRCHRRQTPGGRHGHAAIIDDVSVHPDA
jgi:hypothetical protein